MFLQGFDISGHCLRVQVFQGYVVNAAPTLSAVLSENGYWST